MLNLTRSFIIFDVETTGIGDNTYIVSFSMEWRKPDGSVKIYSTLVKPPVPISAETTKIHGITDDMVRDSRTFLELSQSFWDGFQNADFGGYNVKFDLYIMKQEFKRCGKAFDFSDAYFVDAFRIWQVMHPRTLSDACEFFLKRKHKGAHNSMADVEETRDILQAQLISFEENTPQAIHEKCYPRDPNSVDREGKILLINGVQCFNFGGKKGQPLSSQRNYLEWMLRGNFTEEVKDIVRTALGQKRV
jgi:DNA polymerase-3 subunit epsilon